LVFRAFRYTPEEIERAPRLTAARDRRPP